MGLLVQTDPATLVGLHTATLNGTLLNMAGAASVDVWFEYGEVSGGPYTDTTPVQVLTSAIAFLAVVLGLKATTTYYFRAVADF